MTTKIGALTATIMVVLVIATGISMVCAAPDGGTGTADTAVTKAAVDATTDVAQGGYIAEFNLSALQQTDKWQGYYGNVTGTITLDDASGNTIYKWTISAPTGEVYATTNSSVPTWSSFATTAATLSTVNTAYGFGSAGSDNADDTFTATSNTAFYLAGNSIAASFAPAVQTYGATEAGAWETVVLYDGAGSATTDYLFAGIIEVDQSSFLNQTAADTCDYQMIVPENPSSGTTTYYFYVELT